MSRQTQGSLLLVAVLAATVGIVAFLAMTVIGSANFSTAAFIAILVAAAVAVFLYKAFHSTPAAPMAAPAAAPAPAPAPEPAPEPAPAPAAAPAAPASEAAAPARLDGPREGGADDLKKIKGVGPKMEKMLHGMGFYHFDQVANWSAAEVAWVDDNLQGFKGRVSRDDWVAQAAILASGGRTEFSSRS